MMKHFTRPLALLSIAALAACGGNGNTVQPPTSIASPSPGKITVTGVPFVGVGDSLTFGEQADGLLGDPTATSPLSAYPNNAVPPGQENGWWSLFYQSLTGTPVQAMYNGPTSPLPLIKAPGLNTQIVLNTTSLFANIQNGCSQPNQAAFSSSAWAATRLSPTAPVLDLGVPGITMHEAVSMYAPFTGPPSGQNCTYATIPGDPTSGGLQSLVNAENNAFYPVLGGFQTTYPGSSLTMLNVAAGMKPKLASVWLGANDLLKYIFSNGQSPVTDTPQQLAADLTLIVKTLATSGTKVLVADLPTVLTTPQFFPVSTSANPVKLVQDIAQLLVIESKGAIPASAAGTYAQGVVAALSAKEFGGATSGWYLTETGFLGTVQQAAQLIQANPAAPNFAAITLDPNGPGSGAGAAYITPAFAAQITALNAGYNQAIDQIAKGSGSTVALVPINQTFAALSAPGGNLSLVIPGAPPLTLQFGGGIVSWDGLHPSNAGYAAIADVFMQTAIQAFGTSVTPLTGAQITAIASTDPYNPNVVNAGLGAPVFPLP